MVRDVIITSNGSLYLILFQGKRNGSNEYNDYQPGSLNTTDQLIKDLKDIDVAFHIGDLTYSNGYISKWDQFTAQVEPIASGNHQPDWPDTRSFMVVKTLEGSVVFLRRPCSTFLLRTELKFWYSADYGFRLNDSFTISRDYRDILDNIS